MKLTMDDIDPERNLSPKERKRRYTAEWRRRNREKLAGRKREYDFAHRLRHKYGITPEEHQTMLDKQGGVCAICKAPPPDDRHYGLFVDHDHETGEVRGLLCLHCNTALGMANDDPSRLRELIAYLERHD